MARLTKLDMCYSLNDLANVNIKFHNLTSFACFFESKDGKKFAYIEQFGSNFRVRFCSVDDEYVKTALSFKGCHVAVSLVREFFEGVDISEKLHTYNMRFVLDEVKPGEKKMCFAWNRLYNAGNEPKAMYFNNIILYEDEVLPTITTTHGNMFDFNDKRLLSDETIINACTFPQDFDFCGICVGYICGMAVPPLMIKRIVDRLIKAGIFD